MMVRPGWVKYPLLVVLVAGACSALSRPGFRSLSSDADELPPVPYNHLQQIASHNSYERPESIFDQLVAGRIRSLELDLHPGIFEKKPLPREWSVYHQGSREVRASHCTYLSQCLDQLLAFHLTTPHHEVVTVFLEPKEGFEAGTGHSPDDLDWILRGRLGPSLLTPAEILKRCPHAFTLREAVALPNCGWPSSRDLQGKFIFVLMTAGPDEEKAVRAYAPTAEAALKRAAFIAPTATGRESLESATAMAGKNWAIFLNTNATSIPAAAVPRGIVVRQGVVDYLNGFRVMTEMQVQHVATNKIFRDQSSGFSTSNRWGWPFQCVGDSASYRCSDRVEEGSWIQIKVTSADIQGLSDHFFFPHFKVGKADDFSTWRAFVSTEAAGNGWAKGCLMARADLASSADYFAVCRPATHSLRVQTVKDGVYRVVESSLHPLKGPSFLELTETHTEERGYCYRANVSGDREKWFPIDTQDSCFAHRLEFQGLAASAHGDHLRRFVFGDVTLNFRTLTATGFSAQNRTLIGSKALEFEISNGTPN